MSQSMSIVMSAATTYTPLEEAQSLLIQWKLPQLCATFREQEVCTTAFEYLSDDDIMTLIPKLGPRSIFRANLLAWRQEASKQKYANELSNDITTSLIRQESSQINTNFSNENIEEIPFESAAPVKVETNNNGTAQTIGEDWPDELDDNSDIVENNQIESIIIESDCSMSPVPSNNSHELFEPITHVKEPKKLKSKQNIAKLPTNVINLKELFTNNPEIGHVIELYKKQGELVPDYRKIIVKFIILKILDKKIVMTASHFLDISNQLIKIFPNENIDMYYVRRIGQSCPKGMLYNKYVNMTRKLRLKGELDYVYKKSNV